MLENITHLQSDLTTVLEKQPVVFAYVFGSLAKGTQDSQSDIDIALGFADNFSDSRRQDKIIDELAFEVASALKTAPENIDLKNFSQLPLAVRFRVVRDGKLIFLNNVASHRQQAVRTIALYQDEKPFFDMANNSFFKRHAAV